MSNKTILDDYLSKAKLKDQSNPTLKTHHPLVCYLHKTKHRPKVFIKGYLYQRTIDALTKSILQI